MKRISIILLLLLFISASQGNLFAEIIECIKIDNLYYDLNTETGCATVRDKETGYHASSYYGGTYVIPECVEHNNQKFVVTAIAEYTFCKAGNSKHVLYVTLPKTLRKIGRSAFKYALGLFSIVIPEGITTLPDAVFSDCENLRSVKLPSTLTTIESSAFYGCYLTEITFPQSLKSIGAYAFAYHGFDETIIFPHGLQSIGQRAFYTNRGGDGYVYIIPKSVTSIGEFAFYEINTSRRFYVQWDTPIDLSGSIVCNDNSYYTSVRVPCGTKELYAAADYWKNYGIYEQCIDNSTLYNIEATAVNGTIKGTGQYPYGSYVTLTAVPAEGYRFSQWSDGVIYNPRTEAVTANATYTAEFIEAGNIDPTWQILYTSSDGNVVTPNKTDVFGANIVSNEYIEGQGVITFDGPVTQIGEKAFYNCSSLTSITIPNSVTSIGLSAFQSCSGLNSITIPESVESLGEGATFQQCSALKNVYWNATDCTLEPNAEGNYYPPFHNLDNIEEFVFGNNVTTIPAFLCNGLSGLKAVTIPESVTSLGEGATFQKCTALKNVYWNATDCTLEPNAEGSYYPPFHNLDNIEEFVFGDNVTTIPAYLCYGLSGLNAVTIPNSVTSIGKYAFMACSSLTTITIPESVKSLGEGGTFQQCTALKNVYWNATDCTLEKNIYGKHYPPFYNLDNIEEFVFGNNVTTIPAHLCNGLSGLKAVAIPNSVISIETKAFKACSSLTTITIPESVKNIGDNAFLDCSSLTSITSYATTPPTLGEDVFNNIDNTIPVYVPCGSISAYKADASWNYFKNFQSSEQSMLEVYSNNDTWGQVSITQPTIPYVGFTATADNSSIRMVYGGTLVGCIPNLQYSYDGQSWKKLEEGTNYNVEKGQTIYMRGHNPDGVSRRFDGYSYFDMKGSFEGSGDIMTLVDSTGMTTEAPAYCFYRLFYYCTALTKAPRITATASNSDTYANMFVGCTKLQYIEVDFTKWNTDATENWVSSIASTGTFVKPVALPTRFGSSNIPSGWTVMDKEENDGSTSNVTSGTYECETTLILTATPNDCYQFTKWSDGNTDNPRTIVVNEDATYTAEFMPIPYTIIVESTDETQGSVDIEIN